MRTGHWPNVKEPAARVRGLIELMHWYGSQRRYEDALRLARQVLCEDPFRESVLIGMMWLYVLNGQRRGDPAVSILCQNAAAGTGHRTDAGDPGLAAPYPQ